MKLEADKVDDMQGNPSEIRPITISKTPEQIRNFQYWGLRRWVLFKFQTIAGHQVHKIDFQEYQDKKKYLVWDLVLNKHKQDQMKGNEANGSDIL